MRKLPPVDFKILRDTISPIAALNFLGWRGRREPCGNWRGPCPIHGSTSARSRSFSVSDRVCYCFKCRWHGDAVALWAAVHHLSQLEAAHGLCAVLGMIPPPLS